MLALRVLYRYLLKSMMMSALSLVTSRNLSGVTVLHTPKASRRTCRTLASPICQGKWTILEDEGDRRGGRSHPVDWSPPDRPPEGSGSCWPTGAQNGDIRTQRPV